MRLKFEEKKAQPVPTYSASFYYFVVVVENAVQFYKAGINVSNVVFSQNVAPTEAKAVFHCNKALKTA